MSKIGYYFPKSAETSQGLTSEANCLSGRMSDVASSNTRSIIHEDKPYACPRSWRCLGMLTRAQLGTVKQGRAQFVGACARASRSLPKSRVMKVNVRYVLCLPSPLAVTGCCGMRYAQNAQDEAAMFLQQQTCKYNRVQGTCRRRSATPSAGGDRIRSAKPTCGRWHGGPPGRLLRLFAFEALVTGKWAF